MEARVLLVKALGGGWTASALRTPSVTSRAQQQIHNWSDLKHGDQHNDQ